MICCMPGAIVGNEDIKVGNVQLLLSQLSLLTLEDNYENKIIQYNI